jgi:hypothetical protein
MIVLWSLALLLGIAPVARAAAQSPPSISGCQVLPADNVWNTPIDHLPVDASSAAYVATIGADRTFHPDFGAAIWDGGPIGIPFTTVPGNQPPVSVSFDYADESDPGPYPIPPDAPIEGGSLSDGDRHVLVVDVDNCVLYETFYSWPQPGGSWEAGSGAVFDLESHALRPAGWTSADAAGLPILPGLVRYDEVAAGEIRHALRFTAPQTQRRYVWPARHYASSLTGSQYPPMGKRFRLKASFDISGFSADVQVILRALKRYGMILADNGSAWYISGAPDPRWDDDVLVSEFRRLKGSDFEAVDETSMVIHADSGQARQPVVSVPAAATLVAPAGAVDSNTPAYTWNAVAESARYRLYVSDAATAGRIAAWYTAEQVGCGSGTGTCSVTPATALAPGAAKWWVRTANDAGDGPWSSRLDFTVPNRVPGTPGGRGQRQANGVTPIGLGGTANSGTVVLLGTVTDPDANQAVRLQIEVRPLGTAFTGTVSCESALVASGTASSCAVSGLTAGTSYHWRLRAVDSLGAAGRWVSYATNAETAADFVVNRRPPAPTARGQHQADGTTPIPLGGTATSTTVVFRGIVSDPDAGQRVRLQIEVKPLATAFTGAVSCQSALVASGTAVTCAPSSLIAGTSYRWRARTVDSRGSASAWASYGPNPDTAEDFTIAVSPSTSPGAESAR